MKSTKKLTVVAERVSTNSQDFYLQQSHNEKYLKKAGIPEDCVISFLEHGVLAVKLCLKQRSILQEMLALIREGSVM